MEEAEEAAAAEAEAEAEVEAECHYREQLKQLPQMAL
jgi:hypothetical protein